MLNPLNPKPLPQWRCGKTAGASLGLRLSHTDSTAKRVRQIWTCECSLHLKIGDYDFGFGLDLLRALGFVLLAKSGRVFLGDMSQCHQFCHRQGKVSMPSLDIMIL